MLTPFTAAVVADPLVPTWNEIVLTVAALLFLVLVLAAIFAVLRSGHSSSAKAGMLLLCILVPILGAIVALALAARKPQRLRSPESSYA